MARITTFYNHKGGVSKTTTTFNVANAMAEAGKRVLIVDADPQCNVTELALLQEIDRLDKIAAETGKVTPLPGTTVYEALKPRFQGETAIVDVDKIELCQPNTALPLFLFRGDISFSLAEDTLSRAHSQRMSTEIHEKRNYVAFHDMLRRLGAKHRFDNILIDVGPSAGALTRTCFLACDVFMVPVVPDRFNYQAIESLAKILKTWIEEHQGVVGSFKELGLNINAKVPTFYGLVMQRFQKYGGEPKAGYKVWMEKVPSRTLETLIPALVAAGSQSAVHKSCFKNPTIAEIPEFGAIGPVGMRVGKPVWKLTPEDTTWSGATWTDRKKFMDEIHGQFDQLASHISS